MLIAMATEIQTVAPGALADRERVLRVLRAHEAEIRARGVTRLCLFGSMASGEARPQSDVDPLADIDRRSKSSLIDLVGRKATPFPECEAPGARPGDDSGPAAGPWRPRRRGVGDSADAVRLEACHGQRSSFQPPCGGLPMRRGSL
jgi:nucleotidyltransferase-like protein